MASEDTSVRGATEFTVFPKLPKELRLMIWKKASPGPRLLEIKYHDGNYDDDGPVMHGYFDSDCPLPILFSACKEFHNEFLQQYSLSFPRMMQGPRLYFDPVVDTIVIARLTARILADPEVATPLVYPGGGVFNVIENLCFTSFELHTALQFLKDVDVFDGYLCVKTITIATEVDSGNQRVSRPAVAQGGSTYGGGTGALYFCYSELLRSIC